MTIMSISTRPASTESAFRAIADPTRRTVLDTLRNSGEVPVAVLASPLRISMPGLSRHLRVLRQCGLVTERRRGRERLYRLAAQSLRPVSEWIGAHERFWDEPLANLGAYLERRGLMTDRDGG